MSAFAVVFLCLSILSAFTVLDAPLKRCEMSRWSFCAVCLLLCVSALLPAVKLSWGYISAAPVIVIVCSAAVCTASKGNLIPLRLVGAAIFSAAIFFASALASEVLNEKYTVYMASAVCAVYCSLISHNAKDAFITAMFCMWCAKLSAAVYGVITGTRFFIDLSDTYAAAGACYAGISAFVIKDIICLARSRLTKDHA